MAEPTNSSPNSSQSSTDGLAKPEPSSIPTSTQKGLLPRHDPALQTVGSSPASTGPAIVRDLTKKPDNLSIVSELKQQVNVAVFALIINMGFLKFADIEPFVKTIGQIGSSTVTLRGAIMIICIGIGYLSFIMSVAVGIVLSYLGNNVTKPMLVSLASFFVLYVIFLMRAFAPAAPLPANTPQVTLLPQKPAPPVDPIIKAVPPPANTPQVTVPLLPQTNDIKTAPPVDPIKVAPPPQSSAPTAEMKKKKRRR